MSVLFMESFDSGTVNPITDGGWKWQGGDTLPKFLFNPLIGKQGGGSRIHEYGRISKVPLPIPPGELPERLILQFDLYIDPDTPSYTDSTDTSNQLSYVGLYNLSGEGEDEGGGNNTLVAGLRWIRGDENRDIGFKTHVVPGSASSTGSGTVDGSLIFSEGVWYNIALVYDNPSGSTNRLQVYVDGLLYTTSTHTHSAGIFNNGLGGIRMGPGDRTASDRGYCIIDNLVVIADDGIAPSDMLGPVRVEALRPVAVGSTEPWSQTPPSKPQAEILSGPLNFDEYLYTSADGRELDVTVPTPSGPEGIVAVQAGVLARSNVGSSWEMGLSMGDEEIVSEEVSENPEGEPILMKMGSINPVTGLAWRRQDISSTRWRMTPKAETE